MKQLPNGEAVPLTNDDHEKMSPVFSPDGTRIAYTVASGNQQWNTWIVPTLRGTPRLWLHNASGLTWIPSNEFLFSEVKPGTAQHMAIMIANETRTTSTDLYLPEHTAAMAHRSALSPDGKWVLVGRNGRARHLDALPSGSTHRSSIWAPGGSCKQPLHRCRMGAGRTFHVFQR